MALEGKGATGEIFPVKFEDWIKKPNSAKSILQRTQHRHVVSTLPQSGNHTAIIGTSLSHPLPSLYMLKIWVKKTTLEFIHTSGDEQSMSFILYIPVGPIF